jgi:glycine/D-amino acid oxidase-like deaminating enzyme
MDEDAKRFYEKVQRALGKTTTGRFSYAGTPYHKCDLIEKLPEEDRLLLKYEMDSWRKLAQKVQEQKTERPQGEWLSLDEHMKKTSHYRKRIRELEGQGIAEAAQKMETELGLLRDWLGKRGWNEFKSWKNEQS